MRASAKLMDVELPCSAADGTRLHGGRCAGARGAEGVFAAVATAGIDQRRAARRPGRRGRGLPRARAWLHVDAAYGGAAGCARRACARFAGIEQADPLIVDPHKWLFRAVRPVRAALPRPASAAPRTARTRPTSTRSTATTTPTTRPTTPSPHAPRARGPVLVLARRARHRGLRQAVDGRCAVTRAGAEEIRRREGSSWSSSRAVDPRDPPPGWRRRTTTAGPRPARRRDRVRVPDDGARRDRRAPRAREPAHDRRGPAGRARHHAPMRRA